MIVPTIGTLEPIIAPVPIPVKILAAMLIPALMPTFLPVCFAACFITKPVSILLVTTYPVAPSIASSFTIFSLDFCSSFL